MIRVKVKNYSRENDLYIIKLGNASIHKFTNEKHALNFLCQTSNFLTSKFQELNLLHADFFRIYKELFFYLDNDKNNPHAKLYQTRRDLKDNNFLIDELFDKLSYCSDITNHNFFPFKYLFQITDRLNNGILILKSINQSKSYHSTDVRLNFLQSQVITIKNEIQNYSIKTAAAIDCNFKIEYINDQIQNLKTA